MIGTAVVIRLDNNPFRSTYEEEATLDSHQARCAGARIANLKAEPSVHQEVSISLAVCVFAFAKFDSQQCANVQHLPCLPQL